MANYTELYVQFIFAVANREALITADIEAKVYAYITSVIQNRKHHVIAINGMPDHVHILLRLHPTQSLSDLVRDIKSNSSRFIREEHLTTANFQWQEGSGMFTYSKSQVPRVKKYVNNQKEHHRVVSFREEMLHIFEELGIKHDEQFGMRWISE